jgi:hypothetical protein
MATADKSPVFSPEVLKCVTAVSPLPDMCQTHGQNSGATPAVAADATKAGFARRTADPADERTDLLEGRASRGRGDDCGARPLGEYCRSWGQTHRT